MQFKLSSGALLLSALLALQANAAPPRILPAPLNPVEIPAPEVEGTTTEAPPADVVGGNQAIFEVLEQLRLMQAEISELRELTEQHEHQMTLLTKRQRSLYQDMDRRLLELEAGGSNNGAAGGRTTSSISINDGSGSVTGTPTGNADLAQDSNSSGVAVPGADQAAQMNEKAAYTRAFNILKEGNYVQAIATFREFLNTYPGGKYADNAQYWLGEAIYATRDYKTALAEFKKILSDYQDSPKRKDAELKIGFTYYELKNWSAAREALESVVQTYPDTSNARTAKQRLDRLTREGR